MKSKAKLTLISLAALAAVGLLGCSPKSASSSVLSSPAASSAATSSNPASSSAASSTSSSEVVKYGVKLGYNEISKDDVSFSVESAPAGTEVTVIVILRDAVSNQVTEIAVNETKIAFAADSKLPNRVTGTFAMPEKDATVDVYVGGITKQIELTVSQAVEGTDDAAVTFWAGNKSGSSKYQNLPYYIAGTTVYWTIAPIHDRVVKKVTYGSTAVYPDANGFYGALLRTDITSINVTCTLAFEVQANGDDGTDKGSGITYTNLSSNYADGATVSFTPTLANGLRLEKIDISYVDDDKKTNAITPEISAAGIYTFEMPAYDVSIVGTTASIPPASMTLAPTNKADADKEVVVGKTFALTTAYNPTRATAGATYKSSDETIATVDDKGVVTGVKAGKATITATSTAATGVDATIDLTVVDTIKAKNLIAGKATDDAVTLTEAKIISNSADTYSLIVARPEGTAVIDYYPTGAAGADGNPTYTDLETAMSTAKVGDYYTLTGSAYVDVTSKGYCLVTSVTAFAKVEKPTYFSTKALEQATTVDFSDHATPLAWFRSLMTMDATSLENLIGTQITFKNVWFYGGYAADYGLAIMGDQGNKISWAKGDASTDKYFQFQIPVGLMPTDWDATKNSNPATKTSYDVVVTLSDLGAKKLSDLTAVSVPSVAVLAATPVA